MTGLEYGAAETSRLEIFNSGKRMMGNNATTGIGRASVIHQVIINPAIANTRLAFSSTEKGLTKNKTREIAIPEKSAMDFNCCFDKQPDLC